MPSGVTAEHSGSVQQMLVRSDHVIDDPIAVRERLEHIAGEEMKPWNARQRCIGRRKGGNEIWMEQKENEMPMIRLLAKSLTLESGRITAQSCIQIPMDLQHTDKDIARIFDVPVEDLSSERRMIGFASRLDDMLIQLYRFHLPNGMVSRWLFCLSALCMDSELQDCASRLLSFSRVVC